MDNTFRPARIIDSEYSRFSATLARMGLPGRFFRAAEENKSQVVVHPGELAQPVEGPFLLRSDIVEFVK